MKTSFYLVSAEYMPRLCKPIKAIVAISETPADFYLRNMKKNDNIWGGIFHMNHFHQISKEAYEKCRAYNPTNESYFALKLEDYSEIVE